MRPIALAALLAALPASADETLPGATDPAAVDALPAEGPLAFHAVASIGREHGCSQSFETSSYSARAALTVDATGAARLVVEATDAYVFGPSPGRYAASGGKDQFQRTAKDSRLEYRGKAVRGRGALTLDLRAAEGGAPLRLACRLAPIDVEKSYAGPRLATRSSALLCPIGELIGKHFDLSLGAELPFGRGAGFEASINVRDFDYDPKVRLSRAP